MARQSRYALRRRQGQNTLKLTSFYAAAKSRVIALGYAEEIEWQTAQNPRDINETVFLREAAWVVYCSGFKEAIIRRHFDYLSLCFCDWSSAQTIVANGEQCVSTAMHVLAYRRKHEALVSIASRIVEESFDLFLSEILRNPICRLQELPFLGPVTAIHLAKNLGFDLAKPDRHLLRLKDRLGYGSVDEMCDAIARKSGDPVRVVDLVLWRFLERRQLFEGV